MKKNIVWESLMSIIIWMFILSFVALWVINIVAYNKSIIDAYQIKTDENILKQNTNNILKKADLSWVSEGQIFYINKNKATKTFEILTWTWSQEYKFINSLWDKVADINSFDEKIYARDLYLSTNIVKEISVTTIDPSSISPTIMHFDAQDTDWDWLFFTNDTDEPIDWATIATWINKATGTQPDASWINNPVYSLDAINTFPAIRLDSWSSQWFSIANHSDINLSTPYPNKSFYLMIQTWNDVNTLQNIYEQWDSSKWYAIQIYNWNLYVWMWTWTSSNKKKIINLWAVEANKPYYIVMVQLSPWSDALKWYINGKLINTLTSIPNQTSHAWAIWLWYVNSSTMSLHDGNSLLSASYFDWYIWELISWNHTLSDWEYLDLKTYIEEKWNMGQASILDNVNISIIVKDINYTIPY